MNNVPLGPGGRLLPFCEALSAKTGWRRGALTWGERVILRVGRLFCGAGRTFRPFGCMPMRLQSLTTHRQQIQKMLIMKTASLLVKTFSLALLLLGGAPALPAGAQTAEAVRGIVVAERDSAWYAVQARAWERETRRRPHDEKAWRNLFEAVRYRDMLTGENYARTADVLKRMEREIPGSWTFHFCRYRSQLHPTEARADMERCIALEPGNVEAFDTYLCHYWMEGRTDSARSVGRRYFESGCYSPALLQYSYNQLAGMPDGAIFIGNGDAELIPKIVLQGGCRVHMDKVIVPLSFLALPTYVESLCGELGIDVPALSDSLSHEARTEAFVRHLIARSGRAVYFAPSVDAGLLRPFADRLYSEGLVLRYSDAPYDNMAVMKRNVEQRYLTDYLLMSFAPQPEWSAAALMQLNYAAALQPLLRFYRDSGDVVRHAWLMRLLTAAVDGAVCSEARKAPYRQLLDEAR